MLDVGEQLRGCLGEFVRLQQGVGAEEADHVACGGGAGCDGPGQGTYVPFGDRRVRPQPGQQSRHVAFVGEPGPRVGGGDGAG